VAKTTPLPPISSLNLRFYYDTERDCLCRRSTGAPVVGCQLPNGHHQVRHSRRTLLVHRVAWAVYHQQDPYPHIIDHKDRNPSNNSVGNLRLANHSQNGHNTVIPKACKPGRNLPLGVYRHQHSPTYFFAIKANGQHIQRFGFATPEEASVAREALRIELVGEFHPDYCATG
jgi:hypothetical protein